MTTFTTQDSYDAYTNAFGKKPHSGFRVRLREPASRATSELPAGDLKQYLETGYRWPGEDGFRCQCGREFEKYQAVLRHQVAQGHA